MNRKTTVVLLLLLGALGAAWALLGGEDSPQTPLGAKIFGDILPESVQRVEIVDWSKERLAQPLTLERKGEGWTLKTLALDEGRPLRARRELVEDLIATFCGAVPLGRRPEVAESELSNLKLDAASRIEVALILDDGARRILEIGAAVPPAKVLVRRGGDRGILEVHRQLREDLVPSPERLWDRRLLDLPVLGIRLLAIESKAGNVEIVHEFGKWGLRQPFTGPADRERCEAFRARIAQAKIQAVGPPNAPWTPGLSAPPKWTLRIEAEGRAPVTLLLGEPKGGSVAVLIEGESRPVRVEASALALQDVDASLFRDRRLIWENSDRLRRIVLRSGEAILWDFRRKRRLFRSYPGNSDGPYVLDEVDQQGLLSKIVGLRLKRYDLSLGSFPIRKSLELTIGEPGQETGRSQRIQIGASQDGLCPIRLGGERGVGWIAAEDLEFLDRPAWRWIRRDAGGVGAWWKLGRVAIEDDRGRVEFSPRLGDGRIDLVFTKKGGGEVVLPRSLSDRAVTALCRIKVVRFCSPADLQATGLEPGRLKIQWQLSKQSSAERLAPPKKGTPWQSWVVGKSQGGESYGRSSERPGLVFQSETQVAAVFERALSLARAQ